MNLERWNKSEQWAKEKADEYLNADSFLTFAEWCYQQGKAEEREDAIDELMNEVAQIKGISDEDWDLLEQKAKQLKEQK